MTVAIVVFLLSATAFLFSIELRRRRQAETRLQETLASVEQQVADRTNALSKARMEPLPRAPTMNGGFLSKRSLIATTSMSAALIPQAFRAKVENRL